jgi:4-oxalocrotonate tautomerase
VRAVPFLRITVLAPALAPEQVRRLHQGATDLLVNVLRKPLAGVAVLVERLAGDAGWTIAGTPVPVAAGVDAIIGAGTNTAAEKARFSAEMMALLQAVLGPELREETYIVLHELPHDSYGRGGLTRSGRVAAARVNPLDVRAARSPTIQDNR